MEDLFDDTFGDLVKLLGEDNIPDISTIRRWGGHFKIVGLQ